MFAMKKISSFLVLDLRQPETHSVHNLCNNLLHSGVLYILPNLKQVSLWDNRSTAYGRYNQGSGINKKGAYFVSLKKPSASKKDYL